MRKLLTFLTSVRLAVVLIFILAAFSLAGVFLPQIPQNLAASYGGYDWWVENIAVKELGTAANALAPLGVFHMFRSAWFIGAVSLLMLNILICTAARIRPLRKKTQAVFVQRDKRFYEAETDTALFKETVGATEFADKAEIALRQTVSLYRQGG